MSRDERRKSRQADYNDEVADSNRNGGEGAWLHLTEGIIPKFTGQDKTYPAIRWIQDVEDNAEVFNWTPVQKLLMARRSLSGTAALWLRAEKTYKTWEELKTGISKEFTDSVDIKTIHEMMSARSKKPGESCMDYMLIMKELGRRGKMPDYVAIKYVIEGIQDDEVNKIMLYGATSYSELKEKFKLYELFKEKTKEKSAKKEQIKQKHNDRKVPRCYSCGETNHTSAECPHKEKGLKCFKCNGFGHIASKCTQSAQSLTQTTARATADGSSGATSSRHEKKSYFAQTDTMDDSCGDGGNQVKMADGGLSAGSCHLSNDGGNNTTNDVNKADKPTTSVKVRGKIINALVDSGSDVNLVSTDLYNEIGAPEIDESDIYLSGLGATRVECTGVIKMNIEIDGECYDGIKFYVVNRDIMPFAMLLGQEFLRNCVMCMRSNEVTLKPVTKWVYQICVSDSVVGNEVSTSVQHAVEKMMESYVPQKTKEAPIKLNIVLKDEQPVAQRPRRLAPSEQVAVDRQVNQWLEEKIIQVSYSDYASPVVLVKKKDGSIRVCVDYRRLNNKIVKDEYPLPVIDDHIDKLTGAKIFSTLDLKNGYFHLPVAEESVKYTAFVTQSGQYEFLRAPFGLSVCPKVFTRFINIIYRDLVAQGVVIIFIDDLIIPAITEDEAVSRLEEVLNVASQYGLEINWKKSQLVQRRVEYLGHIIQDGEIRPSQEKTDAMVRFPEPINIKQLHSFIGLTSYFRKYIQDYALIAKPLTDLLRKDNAFDFNDQCKWAFTELKKKLASQPVLKIYNPKLQTEMHTDASSKAYSAILLQRSMDDGMLHPVHYLSRKTSEAESRYTSYELEALAIIEGVKKFRCYLYGRHFKIITDCKAFQLTLNKKDLVMSTRVARWILLLQEYDFEIEHREGSKMQHVDALSRCPYVAILGKTPIQERMKIAQGNDEGLKAIIQLLRDGSEYQDYYLENALLYKGTERHLVVPSGMDSEIIKRAHDNGHFSKTKMLQLINKDYFIKNLSKKVDDYINACIPCLLAERKKGKQEGFLHPLYKEEGPLYTIHLDHIGPMTETKKLYNHILTMVDGFTKFTWLFPVKSTTSKETLDKLRIHQQCFGNPSRLVTDRGTAFTSKDFEEYCKDEGIEHIKITTGVPRANGQVERMHRTIISVLTKLCVDNPTLWYKHITNVQRCLNSTFQRSVNTSPFELLIGVKMKLKDDTEIYELLDQERRDSYILEREEHRKKAKEQILKIQEENRKTFDNKRKISTKYQEGDIVAIKRTQFGVGMKLKPKYLGPYRVVRVKGKDRYDIQKIDDSTEGPRNTSSSCDHMKKWPSCVEE